MRYNSQYRRSHLIYLTIGLVLPIVVLFSLVLYSHALKGLEQRFALPLSFGVGLVLTLVFRIAMDLSSRALDWFGVFVKPFDPISDFTDEQFRALESIKRLSTENSDNIFGRLEALWARDSEINQQLSTHDPSDTVGIQRMYSELGKINDMIQQYLRLLRFDAEEYKRRVEEYKFIVEEFRYYQRDVARQRY